MKKIVFTEEFCSPEQLFPFTLTRQIQDIRVGLFTIREKWEQLLSLPSFDRNEGDYKDLERALEIDGSLGKDLIYLVHGNILPDEKLARQVLKLKSGECISLPDRESIVYCISGAEAETPNKIRIRKAVEYEGKVREIRYPWDIVRLNAWAIAEDLKWVRTQKKKQKIHPSNHVTNAADIFIEKGAQVEHCYLNASDGPIYIARDAVVMEGSLLRGPVAIGEEAVVKMGTRIYGATTIGPKCTAGGEIKNSVFFSHSNKGHDGYIGDSVIGSWCNLGAGTSGSNVKNNGSTVLVWTPAGPVEVGPKCGVFMGDYSRTAINTSINTGTVIGVCCNVFGNGLTPKYISSFSWGSEGLERYRFDKALQDVANWKRMKGAEVSEHEQRILRHVFDHY